MSFNKKNVALGILKGLAWLIINEQRLVFYPILYPSTCKVHVIRIPKIIICPCSELTQSLDALFTSPKKNKLINKCLWHQQRKNMHHIFKQHTRPNHNLWNLLNAWERNCCTPTVHSNLLMSRLIPSHDNFLAKQYILGNNTSHHSH